LNTGTTQPIAARLKNVSKPYLTIAVNLLPAIQLAIRFASYRHAGVISSRVCVRNKRSGLVIGKAEHF